MMHRRALPHTLDNSSEPNQLLFAVKPRLPSKQKTELSLNYIIIHHNSFFNGLPTYRYKGTFKNKLFKTIFDNSTIHKIIIVHIQCSSYLCTASAESTPQVMHSSEEPNQGAFSHARLLKTFFFLLNISTVSGIFKSR